MKQFKNILGLTLLAALTLTSCKTQDDADVFFETPTAQEFANLQDNALEDLKQEFTMNAEDGNVTFTSENGVDITIPGSCLTLDGNSVTGQVDITYVEVFDRGNMLTTDKPTMGITPGGDRALLISGGEFMIEATQDGELLDTTCNIILSVPTSLTGGPDNEMTLWDGVINPETGDLEWRAADNATGQGGVFAEGGEYYAFLQQFGWTNIDRFFSDPRPKTTIWAQAPTGYDYTNSAVYLSYDGEDTGLAALDTFEDGLFSEHYGQIPIGLECHAIFVTEQDGMWRYAIKSVTIAADHVITFTFAETSLATEAELIALINGLP